MSYYEIGVVAHINRSEQAWKMFEAVHGRLISFDDGYHGCTGNHIRVLKDLREYDGTTWYVVLEDDAEPVEGFRQQLTDALAASPVDVVSLYLGTSNPIPWQPSIARTIALSVNESWITSDYLLHAVGYAVRANVIDDLIAWVKPKARSPIDEQISAFCRHNSVRVGYTVPSIVEHKDGPTVIERHPDGAPRTLPRKAWRLGTREQWSSRAIELS